MTSNNVNIGSKHIDIPQNHNNETSCANGVKSFFAGMYRKICTVNNAKNFCIYGLLAFAGGIFGVGFSDKSLGADYSGTSNITMKENDYYNELSNVSSASAFATAIATATMIWIATICVSKKADTTNRSIASQKV